MSFGLFDGPPKLFFGLLWQQVNIPVTLKAITNINNFFILMLYIADKSNWFLFMKKQVQTTDFKTH
ncbi:hypothetical protein RG47T_3904 [Mucilaginibacter polytrichastri]|uniref:Uncharacterized protein n=1 Tax=Mucilaginibacter polytrichastri TaxID=1302689 RepID=A0A1Q6A346_9SPHI|nr:hypothetical protein RG47T_3904 [Mucilaginibacter polytrichastri]